MKRQNQWWLALAAVSVLGGSLLMPLERAQAAPAVEKAAKPVLVSINKADSGELEAVRGIGPALAERIVRYREANGRFERLEDLVRVPGIGQGKFERIREEITL